MTVSDLPIISADSHVTEPAGTYVDYIEPAWRDRAPRLIDGGDLGDVFHVEGFKSDGQPVPQPSSTSELVEVNA